MDIKREILLFCKKSTIHGMYYFYQSRHWLNKSLWCAVLLSSAGLCWFLGFMIWNQFNLDPTVTLVESTHYSTNKVPFPAVLICDSDEVFAPNTRDLTDIFLRRGYNHTTILDFFESISNPEEVLNFDPIITQMHRMLDDIGYSYISVLDMVAKPCSELLVRCTWRSKAYNCSAMFWRVLTHIGYCCQFDIENFRKHASNDTNFDSSPERTKALEIVINGTRIFPNHSFVDGQAELLIMDAESTPTWMDSSCRLESNSSYDVTVDVLVTVASDNVKALAKNTRRCNLPSDEESGSSFYSGCVSNVLMKQVVEHCKCMPYYFYSDDLKEYPNCTWDRYRCILQSVGKIFLIIIQGVGLESGNNLQGEFRGSVSELKAYKACFQRCDYVQYDSQVEYKRRMRVPIMTNNKHGLNYSSNLIDVSVRFGDRTCMKYRREILFTWDQMLANLGGIFGLCMGGSIISVIEMIWFIVNLLYMVIKERLNKVRPLHKNEVTQFQHKISFIDQPVGVKIPFKN